MLQLALPRTDSDNRFVCDFAHYLRFLIIFANSLDSDWHKTSGQTSIQNVCHSDGIPNQNKGVNHPFFRVWWGTYSIMRDKRRDWGDSAFKVTGHTIEMKKQTEAKGRRGDKSTDTINEVRGSYWTHTEMGLQFKVLSERLLKPSIA